MGAITTHEWLSPAVCLGWGPSPPGPCHVAPHHATLTNQFVTSMRKNASNRQPPPLHSQRTQGRDGWGGKDFPFLPRGTCPLAKHPQVSQVSMQRCTSEGVPPTSLCIGDRDIKEQLYLALPGALAQHMAASLNPSSPKAKPTETSATQIWERGQVLGAGMWKMLVSSCLERLGSARTSLPRTGRAPWK